MNIFQLINTLRVRFSEKKVRKTGYNEFQKFYYYTLEDLEKNAFPICVELGLCPVYRANHDVAVMDIVKADDPEQCVSFSVPWELAGVSKQPVQNSGASVTYTTRYLWEKVLMIQPYDEVDAFNNDGEPYDSNKEQKKEKPKEKPYKKARPIDTEEVKVAMQKAGKVEILDKYMQSVNERGTPEQIEEVTKFYTAYKNAITEVTTKLGKPE